MPYITVDVAISLVVKVTIAEVERTLEVAIAETVGAVVSGAAVP